MNIIKILLSTIVVLSCSEQQIWQEIESGKTVKVFSKGFNVNNTNYIFKWSKPIGPDNAESNYSIENDKMLFTPYCEGDFNINLTIESLNNTNLYKYLPYIENGISFRGIDV